MFSPTKRKADLSGTPPLIRPLASATEGSYIGVPHVLPWGCTLRVNGSYRRNVDRVEALTLARWYLICTGLGGDLNRFVFGQ